MAENKTPELRFEGFEGEWEEKVLNTISNRIIRKNINNESTLPLTISAQYGLVDQRDFFNSQIASKDVSGYFLVRNGEFAYNKSFSSEYPFGAIKRLDFYDKGVLSTLYIVFSVKDINSDYLVSYYDSSYWHKEIIKIAAEGARNHGLLNIAPEDFFNTKLYVPKSDSEQQQIGSFFKNLDQQILLTQEKLEKTKTLKKTMLQKMFPQEGSKVPEIRLEGFSGEWEEKSIGQIFSERNERSSEGELLSVTINYGVVKASELDRHDSSSADKSNYKIVQENDIAYNSMRMWQGASGYSRYSGIVSPAYTVIIPSDGINSAFFAYLFKTEEMIHIFEINSQGLTSDTWNLKYPELSQIKVKFPEEVEQAKIVETLKSFESLISTQSQKLDLLKTLKKSFLNKMFV